MNGCRHLNPTIKIKEIKFMTASSRIYIKFNSNIDNNIENDFLTLVTDEPNIKLKSLKSSQSNLLIIELEIKKSILDLELNFERNAKIIYFPIQNK